MRVSRMQGFPNRTVGSILIRSIRLMRSVYAMRSLYPCAYPPPQKAQGEDNRRLGEVRVRRGVGCRGYLSRSNRGQEKGPEALKLHDLKSGRDGYEVYSPAQVDNSRPFTGQDAAGALGYEITATTLPQRVQAWREVAACGPTAVTCWRGGLRSKLTVEFIGDPNVAQVFGGYKAVRAHLVHEMQQVLNRRTLVVLAGLSGAGKTRLLRALRTPVVQVIDLESQARHRGSSFGATAETQPSQQTFENAVAAAIVLGTASVVLVEDESRYVGRRTLPAALL